MDKIIYMESCEECRMKGDRHPEQSGAQWKRLRKRTRK